MGKAKFLLASVFMSFALCGVVACSESSESGSPLNPNENLLANAEPDTIDGYYIETVKPCGASSLKKASSFSAPNGLYACIDVQIEYIDVFLTGTLKGTVVDKDGKPLKNASVNFNGLRDGPSVDEIVTDKNGVFEIPDVIYGFDKNGPKFLMERFGSEEIPEGYFAYKLDVRSENAEYAVAYEFSIDSLAVDSSDALLDVGTIVVEPSYSVVITEDIVSPFKAGGKFELEGCPCRGL